MSDGAWAAAAVGAIMVDDAGAANAISVTAGSVVSATSLATTTKAFSTVAATGSLIVSATSTAFSLGCVTGSSGLASSSAGSVFTVAVDGSIFSAVSDSDVVSTFGSVVGSVDSESCGRSSATSSSVSLDGVSVDGVSVDGASSSDSSSASSLADGWLSPARRSPSLRCSQWNSSTRTMCHRLHSSGELSSATARPAPAIIAADTPAVTDARTQPHQEPVDHAVSCPQPQQTLAALLARGSGLHESVQVSRRRDSDMSRGHSMRD